MKNSKPKQRFSLLTMALAAVLMVSGLSSCTKGENDDYLNLDGLGAISLSAGVQTTTNTRAAVVGETFPANTPNVFGLTAFSGAAAPDDWSVTPYFDNIYVSSDAASALTLATNQYYPANGDKVYFYGYAPVVGSLTAGVGSTATTASYTITGQEDIMAAQVVTGIAKVTTGTQPQPELKFTHKLMQLRFKVVADASFEANKKVTKVIVEKVKTSAKLSIGDGTLIFEDNAADKTLELPITSGTNDEITINGTVMKGCLMFEPVGTDGMVMLQIEAGGVTYNDIEVTLTGEKNGEAGTSHLITLTFKREAITPSASITDWEETGSGSADVGVPPPPPAVGTFKDGGIVYTGTDKTNYKVFSLSEGTSLKWSAKNTYVLNEIARHKDNGKKNVAAMKAFSITNTAESEGSRTTGDFATDFPAAAYCEAMNTGGVTGWYLPASEELKALYDAYQTPANTAAIDASLNSNGGTAFPTSGNFWAGNEAYSEEIESYSATWYLNFADGSTNGNDLTTFEKVNPYSVRCIKHIAPPSPPAVSDLRDGGVVYKITDEKSYKIISLGQGEGLKWSAKDTYVLGTTGQSDSDGKANVAAMKAYSANNTGHIDDAQKTTGIFATDFPAAAYCEAMNKDGVTGWYLPSKDEFVEFGKNFTLDFMVTIIINGGTLFDFDKEYWCSGEDSSSPDKAVHLWGNTSSVKSTEYLVRCIKSL